MPAGGIALLLGIGSFAFYLFGVYPSVSVGDSGEFITAAATLGIPHPPGFPLYTVLAHAFGELLPWANWGYRLNVFSAVCAATSVSLFFLTLHYRRIEKPAAIVTSLLFALANALVVNARASEVFALNTCFIAGLLLAITLNRWVLGAFFLGLGAANHQIMLFLIPAYLAALIFAKEQGHWVGWKTVILSVLALILGLSVYAFLIYRAQGTPFLNIGHPDTWERWWRVLRRADYGSFTLALGETPERSLTTMILQSWRVLKGISIEMTWVGVALAVLGFTVWRDRNPRLLAFAGVGFLMTGPFFFCMGNLPFDAQSDGLLVRFFIAPLLFLFVLTAGGMEWLFEKGKAWAWVLAIPLLFWQAGHTHAAGFRNDWLAYAYGRNNLRTLPSQSTFIMDGGDDTFYTTAYLTQVEKRRPDIRFHDRGGIVFAHPYGEDFRRLFREEKEARRKLVESALLAASQPVYYSTMNPALLIGPQYRQEGLLYTAPRFASGHSLWAFYDLRGIAPWMNSGLEALPDYRTRALYPFFAYQAAIAAGREQHWEDALLFLKTAYRTGAGVLWLEPNIRYTAELWSQQLLRQGRSDLTQQLYEWVVRVK
jgi:hypothetical protein